MDLACWDAGGSRSAVGKKSASWWLSTYSSSSSSISAASAPSSSSSSDDSRWITGFDTARPASERDDALEEGGAATRFGETVGSAVSNCLISARQSMLVLGSHENQPWEKPSHLMK